MASITCTSTTATTAKIKITLDSAYKKSNYLSAGVTTAKFSSSSWEDGAPSLGGTKTYAKDPTSSGTSKNVTFTISGLEPETSYTYYGFYQTSDGLYFSLDEVEFETDSYEVPKIDEVEVSGTTAYLYFTNYGDCPFVNVMYNYTSSSSTLKQTGYCDLDEEDGCITLTGLQLGVTYTVSFQYSTDGDVREGTVSKAATFTTVSKTVTVTEKHYKDGVEVTSDTDDFPVTKGHEIQPGLWDQINSYNNYKFLYVKSSDKKTFYPGDTTWYTFTEDVTFSFYYTNKVSVTTKHMYNNTVIWTDSNSPYSATIGFDFTPFHSNYFFVSDEYICSYAMVGSTKYTSSSEKIAIKTTTDDFTVTYYYTKRISDEELVDGCTARWYNYAAGNTGKWSNNNPSFLIDMGDYAYNNTNFIGAGVIYRIYFTQPSDQPTADGYENYIVATSIPSSIDNKKVIITPYPSLNLEHGSTAGGYMIYLQTINGKYMPIPAATPSSDNGVQFRIATKPDDVEYSAGYEPSQGDEIKLKADDIKKFIHAMDRANFWFTDNELSGIDESIVETGEPIKAITYGGDHENGIDGFYEKLEEFKGYKNFTQSFSDVEQYSPIVATNLIFLKNSINNMLGVL